ncbi:MAG: 6-phospho-3-hexuloisomerase [Thermoprotei archaeon]|nr:MAG: 6-phospho-3-hexuloisomerase [Thermoprotei archaeon]
MMVQVFKEAYTTITNFIVHALNMINDSEIDNFVNVLVKTYKENRKVLVIGAGRSGLVGKAFAMRLMHIGFNVYVLGETIVPALSPGDLVIAISGSGRTKLVVTAAEVAKGLGAKVVAITSFPDSPLGKLADLVIRVPGRTKISAEDDYNIRQLLGIYEPLAPLGTLFELTALITLDSVISELMNRLGISEEDLRKRHANIE